MRNNLNYMNVISFNINNTYNYVVLFETMYRDMMDIIKDSSECQCGFYCNTHIVFEPISDQILKTYSKWLNTIRNEIVSVINSNINKEHKINGLTNILYQILKVTRIVMTEKTQLRAAYHREIIDMSDDRKQNMNNDPELHRIVIKIRFFNSMIDCLNEFLVNFQK